MKKMPEWIERQTEVHSITTRGSDPEDLPKGGFRGYFCTASEIIPPHEFAGFEKIVLAGVEPVISADDEIYNRLEGKQRKLRLDLLYEVSREESMIASSRHLIIGKKRLC